MIRHETPDDYAVIREVNRLAFGCDDEADLVERLREEGVVTASLVAVEGGEVVGHILFSEMTIETEGGAVRAAALAPMAVRPGRQRRGFGSRLIAAGLEACCERGHGIVIVVGHPEYYPRFGFSAAQGQSLAGPGAGEAWMALELIPGALEGVKGKVRYAKAFGIT